MNAVAEQLAADSIRAKARELNEAIREGGKLGLTIKLTPYFVKDEGPSVVVKITKEM